MRVALRFLAIVFTILTLPAPAVGQTREGLIGDLLKDIADVETKVMGLAKAMPASAWSWRPGEGVRSTSEVFMHIAADNYVLPAMFGFNAPAETGITKEYKTAVAFEKRTMDREAVIAELQKSFAFLKEAMSGTPDAKIDATIDWFGRKNSTRAAWISTTTHLHEHLGQLIAYARSNKIVPPWSK